MADLPARVDLTAYRGDTWSQTFRFTPLDLAAATVASWIRNAEGDITDLDVVTDPASGAVTISFPAATDIHAGHYDYDVEVTDGGVVTTWVRGKLTVALDVTNAPVPTPLVAVGE